MELLLSRLSCFYKGWLITQPWYIYAIYLYDNYVLMSWDTYRLCVWCRPGEWSLCISASASGGPSLSCLGCGEHWLKPSAPRCQTPATTLSACLRQGAQTGTLSYKTLNIHHCRKVLHSATLYPKWNCVQQSRTFPNPIILDYSGKWNLFRQVNSFQLKNGWLITASTLITQCFLVTHPLGSAEVWRGPGIWASPGRERAWMRFSQCEVKVIHSCWRRLLLCCPPETDPAWDWGCCTGAGWDLSCHRASFRKKLRALKLLTSPGEERGKTKGWGRWRRTKWRVTDRLGE